MNKNKRKCSLQDIFFSCCLALPNSIDHYFLGGYTVGVLRQKKIFVVKIKCWSIEKTNSSLKKE